MKKLSELQQEKAIACIQYVKTQFEIDKTRAENIYNKLNKYEKDLEDEIDNYTNKINFYDQLILDLKESFKEN